MRADDLQGTVGGLPVLSPHEVAGSPAVGTVSWSAVLAGAAAAAALSLILLLLGVGLGLSSMSPWSGHGAAAETLGVSTIAWLAFTQLAASGLGGYLAGRLRSRWNSTPADEVYFRDTAHGFLAWAVATLLTAATLTSTIAAIAGNVVKVGASMSAVADTAGPQTAISATANPRRSSSISDSAYDVDRLFRVDAGTAATGAQQVPAEPAAAAPAKAQMTTEVERIIARGRATGALPADDVKYLGQLVAQRTGLPQAEAETRVNEGFNKLQARMNEVEAAARLAADKARKASAYATLWMFISLLIGAFIASLAATYGGHRRDLV